MVLMIQHQFLCKKHDDWKKTLFMLSLNPFHCTVDQDVPLTEIMVWIKDRLHSQKLWSPHTIPASTSIQSPHRWSLQLGSKDFMGIERMANDLRSLIGKHYGRTIKIKEWLYQIRPSRAVSCFTAANQMHLKGLQNGIKAHVFYCHITELTF